MLRGSRGRFTSNFGAKVFASNAPIACAQPEVTRTVASSGVAASAMGSARVSMTHRSASGSVSRAAGSRTSTAFEERSVTATRPSAKTSTCSGRPFSGVPAISWRLSTSTVRSVGSSASATYAMTWPREGPAVTLARATAELARDGPRRSAPPGWRRAHALEGRAVAAAAGGVTALPARVQAGRSNARVPIERTVFRRFRMSWCMEYARARLFLPKWKKRRLSVRRATI